MDNGARVIGTEGDLVDLVDSHLSLNLRMMGEVAEDWEIDPTTIKFLNRIGSDDIAPIVMYQMWGLGCIVWSWATIYNIGPFRN